MAPKNKAAFYKLARFLTRAGYELVAPETVATIH